MTTNKNNTKIIQQKNKHMKPFVPDILYTNLITGKPIWDNKIIYGFPKFTIHMREKIKTKNINDTELSYSESGIDVLINTLEGMLTVTEKMITDEKIRNIYNDCTNSSTTIKTIKTKCYKCNSCYEYKYSLIDESKNKLIKSMELDINTINTYLANIRCTDKHVDMPNSDSVINIRTDKKATTDDADYKDNIINSDNSDTIDNNYNIDNSDAIDNKYNIDNIDNVGNISNIGNIDNINNINTSGNSIVCNKKNNTRCYEYETLGKCQNSECKYLHFKKKYNPQRLVCNKNLQCTNSECRREHHNVREISGLTTFCQYFESSNN